MASTHRPNPETDPFRPPTIPTLVQCLHCGEEYESYLIEWNELLSGGRRMGFWCCPTPDCDGKGFGFDIFPVDPDYVNEDGEKMCIFFDDEEDDEAEWDDDTLPLDELDSDDEGVYYDWDDPPDEDVPF